MEWTDDFIAGYNWAVINLESASEPTPDNDRKIRKAFGALIDFADSKHPEAGKIRELIINAWFDEGDH
ncbi:hypothetical protein BLJ79_04165 [Arthrobacter sp. UCD-GKA]|uniref:hypothetical protein n=1 Tax=Arthrobacter sp. UCD-GKA TaxID=1913576 RepID=UPI0008DD2AB0|nr:hypothetical protein [Arthrobacter sp. UCD-GKA]OIH85997.1 hypothetical protein BLJ79_04165 [Arthrobacter sp. UCD-GKA]